MSESPETNRKFINPQTAAPQRHTSHISHTLKRLPPRQNNLTSVDLKVFDKYFNVTIFLMSNASVGLGDMNGLAHWKTFINR